MDYLSLLLAAFLTVIIYLFWSGVQAVNGQYLEADDDLALCEHIIKLGLALAERV